MGFEDRYFQEALNIIGTLYSHTKANEDAIRGCVKGELLREYLIANDLAESKLSKIRNSLLRLQDEMKAVQLAIVQQ